MLGDALERLRDDDDRLALLTVTGVSVDPDLRHATVFMASLPDGALAALEARRPELQAAIAREVRLKRTPMLSFVADPAIAAGERVEEALRRIRRRRLTRRADGFLVVDKQAGWTSHDVVARCRRLLGTRKVGHAGTLDPDATGVLMVGVGRATRLLRFASALPKIYVGEVVLGVTTTSTLDASGEVTGHFDMGGVGPGGGPGGRPLVDRADRAGPARWCRRSRSAGDACTSSPGRGSRWSGRRERSRCSASRCSRPASPTAYRVLVECSSGTYVRVLAADLGVRLGGGAYLRALRRVSIGSASATSRRWRSRRSRPNVCGRPRSWCGTCRAPSLAPDLAQALGHGKSRRAPRPRRRRRRALGRRRRVRPARGDLQPARARTGEAGRGAPARRRLWL